MTVTIVIAAIIIFFILFIIIGWCKGFLRMILPVLSLVATLVIAAFLLNPVSTFLEQNTGIRTTIGEGIETTLGWGTAEEPAGEKEETTGAIPEPGGEGYTDEEAVIESLKLPAVIKMIVSTNNNVKGYIKLGVDSFKNYIVHSLSGIALKLLTYVGLVILIFILIRVLLLVSKVLNHIPVLGGINHFFGAVAGFVEASLILWILCMIISLIAGTELGKQILDVIGQSRFLSFLYEENLLLYAVNLLSTLF